MNMNDLDDIKSWVAKTSFTIRRKDGEILNAFKGHVYSGTLLQGYVQPNDEGELVCLHDNPRACFQPFVDLFEPQMASNPHRDITEELEKIYLAKNADYGSSAEDTYKKFGMTSYAIRLTDKINRLTSFCTNKEMQVKDESIEDTLKDLANYAILALIDYRKYKKL